MNKKLLKSILAVFVGVVIVLSLTVTSFAEYVLPTYNYNGPELSKMADGNPVKLDLKYLFTDDNGNSGNKVAMTGLYNKYIVALYRSVEDGEFHACSYESDWNDPGYERVIGPTEPGEYEFVFKRPDDWRDESEIEFEVVPFTISVNPTSIVNAIGDGKFYCEDKMITLGTVDDIPAIVFTVNGNEETLPMTFYNIKYYANEGYALEGLPACPAEESTLFFLIQDGKVTGVSVAGFTDNEHVTYDVLNGYYELKTTATPDVEVSNEVTEPTSNQVVNITSEVKNNDYTASLSFDDGAVNLTDEEKASGVWVWMELEAKTTASADKADIALIEKALDGQTKVASYISIDIFKQAAGQEKTRVTSTDKPLTITIVVPEELRAAGRTFTIVYTHEGSAAKTIKPLKYDEKTGVLTFAANQFSTYALAYTTATSPKTGDSVNVVAMASLMIISAFGLAFVVKKSFSK